MAGSPVASAPGDGPGHGHGRGKVILLGEHAVVHGHPALAAGLGAGVTVEAARSDVDRIEIPAWGVAAPIDAAVAAVKRELGITAPTLLRGDAQVPARAGLGSSAALAVATTRALAALTGRSLDDDAGCRVADRAERIFHDNPSGVDVALAARGGFGLYRRGVGLEPLLAPPIRLAIGLSGEPRSTAAMVTHVGRLVARSAAARAALAVLGDLARTGAGALGDAAVLGELFCAAQRHLVALEVSTVALDRLVALALGAGACGAKLTGAGGGGAVIAIGDEDAVVAAWRAAGFHAFAAEIGALAVATGEERPR